MSGPTVSEILQEIRSCHAKAVSYFSDAVAKDEGGNQKDAVGLYLNALRYSEEGLFYNVHDLDPSGRQWEEAREMQERMVVTQGKVKERIYELQSVEGCGSNPPAYSVHDPLQAEQVTPSAPQSTDLWAETLISIKNGVQMYFVSSDDQVGAPPPSYPTSLRILRLNEIHRSQTDPEAILQIGDKAYPLLRNQMPILKSSNGVYMFPNCNEDGIQQGSFGIVITRSVPQIEVRRLENILQCYAAYHTENPDDSFVDLTEFVGCDSTENDYVQPRMSDRIASSLITGAEALSGKVKQGTKYATSAIEKGSDNITSKLSPASSKLTINPYLKKGLEYTNEAAKATVKVKDWLVAWLRQVTSAVGEQLGPYFTKSADAASESSKSSMNGAMKVMNAGLLGFGKIWTELEKAGSSIAKAVTTATVKNIEFKYGPDAGEAASLAMGAAVSIGETAFVLENIGAKVVADIGASYLDNDFDLGEPMEFHDDHFNDDESSMTKVDERPHAQVMETNARDHYAPGLEANEGNLQPVAIGGDTRNIQLPDVEENAGIVHPPDTGDNTRNIQSPALENTEMLQPLAMEENLGSLQLPAIEVNARTPQTLAVEENAENSQRMYPELST